MSTNDPITEKVSKLDERVARISEELATHRPVGEIIKYLVYFWAAISVLLGAFGWSKFADLEDVVSDQVRLQLPRDKQEFADFSQLVEKAEALNASYETLASDYEESVQALTYAKKVGVDFDIEGRLSVLIIESSERTQGLGTTMEGGPSDYTGTYLEGAWRKEAIAVLAAFSEAIEKKSFPADFIFNVTQICRRLEQFELAEKLTTAAFKKDPSPPVTALYLSSRVASTRGDDREKAFSELMQMIVDLSPDSPQIVLAEAWNAAENQRRYSELIDALDKRTKAGGFVPSYLFVIRAQATLRRSAPGAIKDAESNLRQAIAHLKEETALSQWFDSTMRESVDLAQVIEKSRQASQVLERVALEPDDPMRPTQ